MNTNLPARRGVIAVIRRPIDDRLLIIRRSPHVIAPLAYCFPGGGLETGESEIEALRRELREELSVEIDVRRRVWECMTPWNIHLAWWTAYLDPLDAEPQPSPLEVSEYSWVTLDDMLALPGLLDNNAQFVIAVREGRLRLDDEGGMGHA